MEWRQECSPVCGIAGIIVRYNRSLPDLQERLAAMAGAMRHRGPDDAGIMIAPDGHAGLANCRLAVRDLSPAGHMPMGNEDGTVWITYNGEIYNTYELRPELEQMGFVFRSHSDTEVILHGYEAWGRDVVNHLRGMFAFAIVSLRPLMNNLERVLLARDHLGVKPLYYAQTPDVLLFASELKALLASGLAAREISPAALVGYLLMGSVPNPLTI
jgi:asparagine synthase (glutamine-hydrolysing)